MKSVFKFYVQQPVLLYIITQELKQLTYVFVFSELCYAGNMVRPIVVIFRPFFHPMKIYNAIQCTGIFSYSMITEYLKMINIGRNVMPEWYLLSTHKKIVFELNCLKQSLMGTEISSR